VCFHSGDGVFDRWPAYEYENGKLETIADPAPPKASPAARKIRKNL